MEPEVKDFQNSPISAKVDHEIMLSVQPSVKIVFLKSKLRRAESELWAESAMNVSRRAHVMFAGNQKQAT